MSLHSCAADCSVLQQLYADGYEVATHSLSHQKVRACCGWLAVQVAGREVEHCLLFSGVAPFTPQLSCTLRFRCLVALQMKGLVWEGVEHCPLLISWRCMCLAAADEQLDPGRARSTIAYRSFHTVHMELAAADEWLDSGGRGR